MFYADGTVASGEWQWGFLNGKGQRQSPDGTTYVGEFRNNRYNGKGVERRPDGTVSRAGHWEAGQLSVATGVDPDGFKFDRAAHAGRTRPSQLSTSSPASSESERLAAEVEAERKRRQELEERLAAETRERERLIAEARERERPPTPLPAVAPTIRSAHALVIGNAAYPGSGRLDNPVNDATAISQKLRAMGFTVTTVTDANRQRLVQAMSQFRRSAASAEVSLLFYSGHGVQVFGKNYMLPTDVDQTDVAQATIQGVSLNEVVENFLPGKTKLVFLDACRDNPLQRTGDRSVSRGLAPIAVAEGTLIAYATKDGQVASDGTGQRNSPFTQALLEHLSDQSDIAVVLRKVREKVMRATGGKQQPWEYGSLTGGELVLSALVGRQNDGLQPQASPNPGGVVQSESLPPRPQAAREPGATPTSSATGQGSGAAAGDSSAITFRVMRAGVGASPGPTDTVRIHYRGTFPDGREFDSSYSRGQPAQFPLNRVIRCWTEGIQRMKVGGSASLVCPPNTAYGERGTPGGPIPSNATLHFEVELLQIVR